MIGKQLNENDPYQFAEKEKSNFSKMLKGERPLKHEYIIPLEKIFGVPMARLMDDGAYLLPPNKDDIPFIKSFRYYAYKDEKELYEDEFEKTMVTNEGFPAICNTDEFNKTFLDYVVEYHSINALKYLVDKHSFKPCLFSYNSFQIDNKFSIFTTMENELYKMVILEDDVDLFNLIFDPFTMCVVYRTAFDKIKIDLQTLEFILNSNKIFNSLFEPKKFLFKTFNNCVVGRDEEIIELINPLLNQCLDYALSNLDKYFDKAKRILEFGINYNAEVIKKTQLDPDDLWVREYGNLFYGQDLLGNLIYPECTVEDEQLMTIYQQLPLVNFVKGR